jgi:hypothetical protein
MPRNNTDPRGDIYIEGLPEWQQAICRVNIFLYDGAIVPDPEGIITGGHDNKTARTGGVGRLIKLPDFQKMIEK